MIFYVKWLVFVFILVALGCLLHSRNENRARYGKQEISKIRAEADRELFKYKFEKGLSPTGMNTYLNWLKMRENHICKTYLKGKFAEGTKKAWDAIWARKFITDDSRRHDFP